jgi:hypothetical protein
MRAIESLFRPRQADNATSTLTGNVLSGEASIMTALHHMLQWFTQNPLGGATLLYVIGVAGVLIYGYFEPQDKY